MSKGSQAACSGPCTRGGSQDALCSTGYAIRVYPWQAIVSMTEPTGGAGHHDSTQHSGFVWCARRNARVQERCPKLLPVTFARTVRCSPRRCRRCMVRAPHRADVGEVGVPDLHRAVGGQRDQAPQLPVVLDVPHLVVLLPRAGLRSACETSAWAQENIRPTDARMLCYQLPPFQLGRFKSEDFRFPRDLGMT